MAINEEYSFKDFTGQSFTGVDASEFNNSEIIGSCFYQEYKNGEAIPQNGKDIFPAGMTGVTFSRCALDNVNVPAGNTVQGKHGINSSNKVVQEQNDIEPWVMTWNGATKKYEPIEPLNKQAYLDLELSVDPKDIPALKMDINIIEQNK
jgi:hypothetical protein